MVDDNIQQEAWFRTFFDRHYSDPWLLGPAGDFVTEDQTDTEVDFIVHALELQPGASVLDVGCGPGRHSRQLARRGYIATGIDLSRHLLLEGARVARGEGVHLDWVQADMRHLSFRPRFAAAISMYTSLGYFDSDAEDLRVLQGITSSLIPAGKLLLDTANRDEVVAHLAPSLWWEANGRFVLERRELDLLEGRLNTFVTVIDRSSQQELYTSVRLYTLPELCNMLEAAGLVLTGLWGDFDGSLFCRDSPRLILLGEER